MTTTGTPTGTGGPGFKPFRILVTGSRDWPDARKVYVTLNLAAQEFGARAKQLTIVHGGCPNGADLWAHVWTQTTPMFGMTPVVEEVHRADWKGQGRSAGPWRNRRMVDSGVDLCLAFIRNNSRGATHCAEYAAGAGTPVRYYRD